MPDVLWDVFRPNRALADVLTNLVGSAINAWIVAKHGLRSGVIAFLHTFNGRLEFNTHVHTMVPAGGWHPSSRSWVSSVFFVRNALMRLWRDAVLDLLHSALGSRVLRMQMSVGDMEAMLVQQERWWSVKINSLDTIEHFFQYSGRYARRPVIAQSRINYIDKQTVQFWSKDKRSGDFVQVRCSPEDFIDRWAQHIRKRYKHSVRYFGIFAPRAINQMFDLIFAAIGQKRQPRPKPPRWADSRKQMSGRDPLLDRIGKPMHWARRLAASASL